jgi:hypothetical protein
MGTDMTLPGMIVDISREPIQKLDRFRSGVTEYFRQDAATKVFALVVRNGGGAPVRMAEKLWRTC